MRCCVMLGQFLDTLTELFPEPRFSPGSLCLVCKGKGLVTQTKLHPLLVFNYAGPRKTLGFQGF